jgi:hypothetical protein
MYFEIVERPTASPDAAVSLLNLSSCKNVSVLLVSAVSSLKFIEFNSEKFNKAFQMDGILSTDANNFFAIYGPMIYTAPNVIFLMRADPLRGQEVSLYLPEQRPLRYTLNQNLLENNRTM